MKLLVTGGAGFIGSNFIHYWFTHHPEDTIVNLDALTYAGNLQNLEGVSGMPNYTFVKGDIADPEIVDKAMEGIDAVVHFAAETHVDRSIIDSDAFIRTNVLGTNVLLKAALKHNVKRFHHVSTDEVYGHIPLDSDEVWTEESPYKPRSPYSASKAGSDHLVRAYYATYGLPITITNCANNVGPYIHPEKLWPLAITNLIEGKKVPIYGKGDQVREWLYVEEHCSAIEAVLERGEIGETYFVGPKEKHQTNLEVIKRILAFMKLPESRIEYVTDRPGHDQKYDLSIRKIKNELGWEPRYTLDEVIEKTVSWYRQNQAWWKKIKAGQYQDYYKQQYGKSV